MIAFAHALEIIPRQICDNAGLDSTDILNKLRMRHKNGETWAGVDVDGSDGVRNNMEAFVWEPSLVKVIRGVLYLIIEIAPTYQSE